MEKTKVNDVIKYEGGKGSMIKSVVYSPHMELTTVCYAYPRFFVAVKVIANGKTNTYLMRNQAYMMHRNGSMRKYRKACFYASGRGRKSKANKDVFRFYDKIAQYDKEGNYF